MQRLYTFVVPVFIGLLAIAVFHATVSTHPDPRTGQLAYGQAKWDEGFYVHIAEDGYTFQPGHDKDFRTYSNLPFSPGYPFLLRTLHLATGVKVRQLRLPLSAVLFLIACIGMSVLFRTFSDDPLRNNLALALFAFWPGSLYFLTGYAEALYLPVAVWCLVFLRRRWFWAASVTAGFALFTRSPAVILVPTVLATATYAWFSQPNRSPGTIALLGLRLVCFGAIAALGIAGYMAVLWHDVGEPFGFLKAYAAWNPVLHTGFDNYTLEGTTRAYMFFNSPRHYPVMIGMAFFLAMPLIVFPMRRCLPMELVTFTVVGWVFLLSQNGSHDPFIDQLRWSAILFPVHYCVSCWLMKIRGSSLPRQACFWTVAAGVLALLTSCYVIMITRFVSRQWVS